MQYEEYQRFTDTQALVNTTELFKDRFGKTMNLAAGGGQLGYGPRLPQLDAASPLIFNPAIIIMTGIPAMWKDSKYLGPFLKNLFEVYAEDVTGIDFGLTMDFAQTPVGQDGQQGNFPTRTTRTAVNPSFTWTEMQGNIVWEIHKKWMSDIQHPDTQASRLAVDMGNSTPQWLYSTVSASMMVIQPDPTMLPDRIIKAYHIWNMIPQETGTLGVQRTIGTTEKKTRSITYTGIVQENEATLKVGQLLMEAMQLYKVDYEKASTLSSVQAAVRNAGQLAMTKDVQDALKDYSLAKL